MIEIQNVKIDMQRLVNQFQRNYSEIHSDSYEETSTRVDYINKFFRYFGWDVENDSGKSEMARDVVHEASVSVLEGEIKKNKKPDYEFRVHGESCFYVEAKKPSVNILNSKDAAFQLRRYGWSAGMQFGILTNFEYLVVYDCTMMPKYGDDPAIGRMQIIHYEEFPQQVNEINQIVGKNVLEGHNQKLNYKKTSFDKFFLDQIQKWRVDLSKDLLKSVPAINESAINLYVQRFINKSLFLRICEDRNLERYEQLKSIQSVQELHQLFNMAEEKYDSGIFDLLDKSELNFSSDAVIKFYQELYFPKASYDFSVIPPSVLARVYDLFLDKSITINNGKVILKEKPEYKEANGAIATPKAVSDFVTIRAIDQKLDNKDFTSLDQLKICDPCCGSGSFLLSSFQRLKVLRIKELSKNVNKAISEKRLFRNNGKMVLSITECSSLLKHSIFGIDIDPEAVEVCKFSLLLECINGLSMDQLAFCGSLKHLLPNLDKNIIFGNSLVDNEFYKYVENNNVDQSVIDRVVPLDIMDAFNLDGFDIIVGNPPYVRVQKMNKYSHDEYLYMKSEDYPLKLASKIGTLDKYYLFVERALLMLRDDGVCGYVIPNKFMHEKNGAGLRKFLSEKKALTHIVNFNEMQLFEGVSVYVCILFLSNTPHDKFRYTHVTEKSDLPTSVQMKKYKLYSSRNFNDNPWEFYTSDISCWYDRLDDRFKSLNAIADIFVGLQTSYNKIFYVKPDHEDKKFVYFYNLEGNLQQIERNLLRPAIYKTKLRKYNQIASNYYLIYPYVAREGGKYAVITQKDLEQLFPSGYSYLKQYKLKLAKRNINEKNAAWYQYGRNQSISKFDDGKMLIWSVLTPKNNFVFAETPVAFTGGGNGPYYGLKLRPNIRLSLRYVQAILNSDFISRLLEESSIYFTGGYYSSGKQFISKLPIRMLNPDNADDKVVLEKIENRVRKMEMLTNDIQQSKDILFKTKSERQINALENMNNLDIKALYGVN